MKTEKMETIIYTPSGPIILNGRKHFRLMRLMVSDLVSSCSVTWQLFVRDFRARYRQSALGIVWAVLLPAATIALFTLMNKSGVLTIPEHGVPYPVYAIIGISLWSFIVSGISGAASALTGAGSMVVKINFPRIALVLAAIMQATVDLMIRVLLAIGLFCFYGVAPDPTGVLLAFFTFIPLMFLVTGLGCILSLFGVIFRDTSNMISLAFSIVMLLTPVLYPIPASSFLGSINLWNPFNYMINVPRDLILRGNTTDMIPFVILAFFCVLFFWVAWTIFYVSQQRIAERI